MIDETKTNNTNIKSNYLYLYCFKENMKKMKPEIKLYNFENINK
jgi:hypothetical protein